MAELIRSETSPGEPVYKVFFDSKDEKYMYSWGTKYLWVTDDSETYPRSLHVISTGTIFNEEQAIKFLESLGHTVVERKS